MTEIESEPTSKPKGQKALIKKILSIGFRLLIAVVGLTYVAYNLNLNDQVRLPALYLGQEQEKSIDVKVIEQNEQGLKVILPDEKTLELTWSEMGEGEDTKDGIVGKPWYRPGLVTTIWNANWWLLGVSLLMICSIFPVQTTRWMLLLRCRGIEATWYRCFKLLMVGCFYNTFMMGSTGGDVMKAVYVARGHDQKTIAVMSVIVDRVIGLIALLLLGALASLTILHREEFHQLIFSVWGLVLCMTVGMVVYFSRRIRRVLGLDWLLARLPAKDLFNKVDQAAVAYRDHKKVVLSGLGMSIPVHFIISTSAILILYAVMPSDVDSWPAFTSLMTIFPVIFLIMAIPISIMGVGVVEPAGIELLRGLAGANEVFMTLVLVRFFMLLWSLFGAIFVIRGDLSVEKKSETESEDTETVSPSAA